ncbi:hypothetical protein VCHC51A1_3750 [Vibrio cholerae HC-51A1]|nr:hypothetical protein VCHC56A1_3691 [Vibrio cholerae HC-56A1]EKG66002.1 hypothetical protein VCHC57A1_3769 [Vibrio cholerae HC-57A1]EKG85816.1 hypothetical protein VCHC51A1_3750 [Vibrio cholerae HC-51A1]EKL19086.1 hypothetical protein VCHC60A1_3724 [Vibrio cholerae HC-60A1]
MQHQFLDKIGLSYGESLTRSWMEWHCQAKSGRDKNKKATQLGRLFVF